MTQSDPQMKIRLPADAKTFVQEQAQRDASSQNSVIVRAIRAAMNTKGPAEAATSPSHDQNHYPAKNGGVDVSV